MSNKMLIDSTHPEETRVVVLRGNRVEEFDFEAADRQQLRGNIYLAKVTRVEPSLQAAFVEYGGNRHGFLAFSEIHPDYYQIPVADRRALLAEHAAEAAEEARRETRADDQAIARREAEDRRDEESGAEISELAPDSDGGSEASNEGSDEEPVSEAVGEAGGFEQGGDSEEEAGDSDEAAQSSFPDAAEADADTHADNSAEAGNDHTEQDDAGSHADGAAADEVADPAASEELKVESVGAEDALEEVPGRRKPRPRQYKIQEVIKRRQVLLVQVVKEERGTKGAALTTYLSLAGRYSVLMPNTARGGGISRKITNAVDRKRLKSVASDLEVPQGMGVILRTAGANRTKTEIKRDFEYLLRLWENVRELTLRSTAPKLVYEEGSLIKRSIRDLYSREIDQVVVAGDDAYREAKDFMRMLMPSHAKNVQPYRDDTPIFSRNGVETQLDAMFSPQVTLRSGGYIVINQTEALVAIDVNSGRSTREHSIEDTALNTNLEAAEEVARQLRLRDLAGLIVIDFIDMEENRNNRAVERKLKDALRADRARIQLGRISHFGLMEMSRQRIRTGVLESSVVACPHCRGTGQVRSISSLSLQILRALEDYLLRHNGHHLVVHTRPEVALYVLNQKRQHLAQLESRFGLTITLLAEAPHNGAGYVIDRGEPVLEPRPAGTPAPAAFAPEDEIDDEAIDDNDVVDEEDAVEDGEPASDGPRQERGTRSRRGGRDRSDRDRPDRDRPEQVGRSEAGEAGAAGDEEGQRRRRRRRRRGGEDRPERQSNGQEGTAAQGFLDPDDETVRGGESIGEGADNVSENGGARATADDESGEAKRRRRGRRGGRRRGRGRDEGGSNEESRGVDFAGETYGADDVGEGPDRGSAASEPNGASAEAYEPAAAPAEGGWTNSASTDSASSLTPAAWNDETEGQASEAPASQVREPEDPIERISRPSDAIPDVTPEPAGVDDEPAAATAEAATPAEQPAAPPPEDTGPKRSGWWNRRSIF